MAMWMKEILLGVVGFCCGTVASGGIFSVLAAVGLVPRFAGKTGTAKYALWYEEAIVLGAIVGTLCSLFHETFFVGETLCTLGLFGYLVSRLLVILYGTFSGIFVGCLALAIAEMLNSIPIFARRIRMRHGLGICIVAVILGKMFGSFFYYLKDFQELIP